MKWWCSVLTGVLAAGFAQAQPLKTFSLHVDLSPAWIYSSDVRVGVQAPDSRPIGDILYFTGFGDRLDNHGPLFDEWTKAGFRVISFDYPSHGETTGTSLNLFTFRKLSQLAVAVARSTREDVNRPLILAGWSTGGLLAVRMMQTTDLAQFDRPVRGLILFAPGISVRSIVGQPTWSHWLGEISDATLTHDPHPPHNAPAKPAAPVSRSSFVFSLYLKVNSILAQHERYPKIPTLVFVGGEQSDLYADTDGVKNWVRRQDEDNGAEIELVERPGARHELDNETAEFGGPKSRALAAQFAKFLIGPTPLQALEKLN